MLNNKPLESEEPLVSIIMNCFNGEKFLKEAIDSVYAQSFTNWEIIFWDNGSSDNSAAIAKSYDDRLKYFFVENTSPLGKARNLAMKKAKGDYIAFLDCDDKYLSDKIRIQLTEMQSKKAKLSYGGWIKINESGEELKKYKFLNEFGNKFEELYKNYSVNSQTLMIKHNYLLENNITFDQNLKFSVDHNIVMRIAFNTPVLSIDKTLAKYRVHDKAMSKTRISEKYEDMEYTRTFFESIGAHEKIKNFEYLSSKSIVFMRLRDSFYERNYKKVVKYYLDFLRLFMKDLSNRFIKNNYK